MLSAHLKSRVTLALCVGTPAKVRGGIRAAGWKLGGRFSKMCDGRSRVHLWREKSGAYTHIHIHRSPGKELGWLLFFYLCFCLFQSHVTTNCWGIIHFSFKRHLFFVAYQERVPPWVAACYCRHCNDIGPSVILPSTRKGRKMIAYPSVPLKARCLYIVYPSQSTPDHLY